MAKLLRENAKLRLNIIGHMDNRGTPDYNMNLSRRRAAGVVAALVRDYRIAADRPASSGAGLTSPVAPNDTDEGRARNRRVELLAR
ncbi:OmpA family protein [Microvirga massiliensis]|uniref:OmpA family protein n=1 Tax=Microvirga massiliensis TaxID=1033741 RepID=UPI003CC7FE8D